MFATTRMEVRRGEEEKEPRREYSFRGLASMKPQMAVLERMRRPPVIEADEETSTC